MNTTDPHSSPVFSTLVFSTPINSTLRHFDTDGHFDTDEHFDTRHFEIRHFDTDGNLTGHFDTELVFLKKISGKNS